MKAPEGDIGQVLGSLEIGKMVLTFAQDIANAQAELDLKSIESAQKLIAEKLTISGTEYSLLELGFMPTFYHISKATIEVSVQLQMKVAEDWGIGGSISVAGGFGDTAGLGGGG